MFEYAVYAIFIVSIILIFYHLLNTKTPTTSSFYYSPKIVDQRLTQLYYTNSTEFYSVVREIENMGYTVINCGNTTTPEYCIVVG